MPLFRDTIISALNWAIINHESIRHRHYIDKISTKPKSLLWKFIHVKGYRCLTSLPLHMSLILSMAWFWYVCSSEDCPFRFSIFSESLLIRFFPNRFFFDCIKSWILITIPYRYHLDTFSTITKSMYLDLRRHHQVDIQACEWDQMVDSLVSFP